MPLGFQLLIAFVVGGVLGWLFGWLWGRARAPAADSRLETELRQQLQQREAELAAERARAQSAQTDLARARAEKEAADRLLAEQRVLHERALNELKEAQSKALEDLRNAFKALSVETLRETAPDFVRLAEQTLAKLQETAKGDLEKRQEAIQGLVQPLKEQLEAYQRRLQQSETQQADALGKLKQQLDALAQTSQALAQETQQFRIVLKSSQARGRWGEETLRRVVEAAGMSAHCDFSEQARAGDNRPDLIVHLPGNRDVIVDAKVPDLEFMQELEQADPARRRELVTAHARKLRETIKALAARDYPRQFPNALDHVVLFLPAESLFSTALEGDPDLIVWAEEQRVYLATPASFIAVLRTINFIWQQHQQTENARQIAEAAREFYRRVVTFTEHLEKIRAGLERAQSAFNDAVGSYERMVRPAGERLKELGGAAPGRELAELGPLDKTLRLPSGNP
ncbi:MAG: DNA recombination protein RmuC [Verrucomicrobiae bacterium]|nr:DNA recombination protein RmuC [Verrucomicrobiae bacterium]MDW8309783.1 DNA recombination protein RmuC [Verrucomicrobiales bacterium]